jgi:16S rRNA (cytosine967-C5)-methyltransferase
VTATSATSGSIPRSAREAAFVVLHRAEAADAFVSILLHRTLERSALSDADRALATAITLGVLRHRGRLDYALARLLDRPLERLPASIRTILRMGAYQILDLDRIPPAAAVSESVRLARRHGHAGTARLVNAVLRRLAAEGPPALPDPSLDPIEAIAITHAHPRWLVARWVARWGPDETSALAAANTQPAPSVLRVNTLRATREAVIASLRHRGLQAVPGQIAEAVRVHGSLVGWAPLVEQGWCVAQDEGSMLVAHAAAPRPGSTVIDACAGTGGKATHLAALMTNTGRVVACDLHPAKLRALAARSARLGATCVEAHHLDARDLASRFPAAADVVLVDAPCSGLGTIRRRPEIKWRASPEDLPRHAERQRALLEGCAGAVRRGGVLVYSVCSLEPEEGPEVVRAFLAHHREFAWDPMPEGFPQTLGGHLLEQVQAGEVFLFPHRHETDGFYLARLRRR